MNNIFDVVESELVSHSWYEIFKIHYKEVAVFDGTIESDYYITFEDDYHNFKWFIDRCSQTIHLQNLPLKFLKEIYQDFKNDIVEGYLNGSFQIEWEYTECFSDINSLFEEEGENEVMCQISDWFENYDENKFFEIKEEDVSNDDGEKIIADVLEGEN